MSTVTNGYECGLREKWRAEGREEGRLENAIIVLCRILETRGLGVPEGFGQLAAECTDIAFVMFLILRAYSIEHAEDLFSVADLATSGDDEGGRAG